MTGKPKLLDLFSGIGGFSLGLEAAGYETAAFCEINAKCRHLLAHHWPGVPAFDDITTLTGEQVGPVDGICGGFPCQDISFAGKGEGIAGERSGLWRHYARLIGELRPRHVFVENVAALLGRGLGDVLGDLASLGYDAWWDCIPAAAVGAPHRRDRLWLVAYPGSLKHEGYGDALRREIAAQLSRAAAEQGVRAWHDAEANARCQPANGGPAMADPAGERQSEARRLRHEQPSQRLASGGEAIALPDAPRFGRGQGPANARGGRGGSGAEQWAGPRRRGGRVAQSRMGRMADGLPAQLDRLHGGWAEEPDTPRVAVGVPARVARLHGLGNAVVPQIPEILGRAVLTLSKGA